MRMLLYLALVVAAAAPAAADTDLSPLRTLAIQEGGRNKPLDTFARETARRVSGARAFTGGESIAGLEPAEWVISLVSDPRRWEGQRMFRVTHAALRERIALAAGHDRFSFQELVGHKPFLEAAEEVQERMRIDPDARLDPVEQEVAGLYGTLSTVAAIFSGEALRMVPNPAAEDGSWLTVADLGKMEGPAAATLRQRVGDLAVASRQGDREALAVARCRSRCASWLRRPILRRPRSSAKRATTASSRSGSPGSCTWPASSRCWPAWPCARGWRPRWVSPSFAPASP